MPKTTVYRLVLLSLLSINTFLVSSVISKKLTAEQIALLSQVQSLQRKLYKHYDLGKLALYLCEDEEVRFYSIRLARFASYYGQHIVQNKKGPSKPTSTEQLEFAKSNHEILNEKKRLSKICTSMIRENAEENLEFCIEQKMRLDKMVKTGPIYNDGQEEGQEKYEKAIPVIREKTFNTVLCSPRLCTPQRGRTLERTPRMITY